MYAFFNVQPLMLSINNIEVHSRKQLASIINIQGSGHRFSRKMEMQIATQLTVHGLTESANSYIQQLRKCYPGPHIGKYLDFLGAINLNLAQYKVTEEIERSSICAELLSFDSMFFKRNNDDHLIIVFATAWNNFGVSFPVLHMMLKRTNQSILYIKNPARGMYTTGSSQFGDNIDSMCEMLKDFVNAKAYKKVSVIGFSGGGYASLFAAGVIGADSYIGFAVKTDWSMSCPIPHAMWRTRPALDDYAKNSLVNLAEHYSMSRIGKATLYYGDLDTEDCLNAENMDGLKNFNIIPVRGSAHNVILPLVAKGHFEAVLNDMHRQT